MKQLMKMIMQAAIVVTLAWGALIFVFAATADAATKAQIKAVTISYIVKYGAEHCGYSINIATYEGISYVNESLGVNALQAFQIARDEKLHAAMNLAFELSPELMCSRAVSFKAMYDE